MISRPDKKGAWKRKKKTWLETEDSLSLSLDLTHNTQQIPLSKPAIIQYKSFAEHTIITAENLQVLTFYF